MKILYTSIVPYHAILISHNFNVIGRTCKQVRRQPLSHAVILYTPITKQCNVDYISINLCQSFIEAEVRSCGIKVLIEAVSLWSISNNAIKNNNISLSPTGRVGIFLQNGIYDDIYVFPSA